MAHYRSFLPQGLAGLLLFPFQQKVQVSRQRPQPEHFLRVAFKCMNRLQELTFSTLKGTAPPCQYIMNIFFTGWAKGDFPTTNFIPSLVHVIVQETV